MAQLTGSGPGHGTNYAMIDAAGRLFTHISGNIVIEETTPIDASKNNPAWKFEYIISGTAAGVTGSSIGSITQFIGTGSYVQTITWSNNLIINLGSFS